MNDQSESGSLSISQSVRLLKARIDEADTSDGEHPFLFDTMSLFDAKRILQAWADAGLVDGPRGYALSPEPSSGDALAPRAAGTPEPLLDRIVQRVGAMLQAPTLPAAGEVGTRPREPYPIPLNAEQERAAKNWAADDRLWTTQETVQFNLGTFAREVLKHQAAGLPDGAALQALVEELLQRIEGGHKQSIGSIDNVRMVQYDVEELARYRAELAALVLRFHSEEGR